MSHSTVYSISKSNAEIKLKQGFSNPLVSNTKSSSDSILAQRLKRYFVQHLAATALYWESGEVMGKEAPIELRKKYHRTVTCMRSMLSNVKIHQSVTNGKTFYSGLMVCGSVWACPVCAAKIQAKRTIEVQKMFNWAYKQNPETEKPAHQVAMLTLTFPHGKGDDLAEIMKKHSAALTEFRAYNGSKWQKFKKEHGFSGLIRSLEVTYGANGFHPHTHELWVLDYWEDKPEQEEAFYSYVLERWEHSCRKVGLLTDDKIEDFRKNSVNIQFRATSTDYINKQNGDNDRAWGADKEIASASTKLGKKHGRTPFQLLIDAEEETDMAKRIHLKKLFLTYVRVFQGKAQLFWSHGLKGEVGVIDKTDEELAEEQTDQADLLAILNREQWHLVVKEKSRAELLNIAEKRGFSGIAEWFSARGVTLNRPTEAEQVAELAGQVAKQEALARKIAKRQHRKRVDLMAEIRLADSLAAAKTTDDRLAIIRQFMENGGKKTVEMYHENLHF